MPQKNRVLSKINVLVEGYRHQLIEWRGEAGRVLLGLFRYHYLFLKQGNDPSIMQGYDIDALSATYEKWRAEYPALEAQLHAAITGAGRDPDSRFRDLANAYIDLVAVFAIRRIPATKRWIGPDTTEAARRGIEVEDDGGGYELALPASPPTIFDHFAKIGLRHEDLLKHDGIDWAEARMLDLIRSDPDNSLPAWMREALTLTGCTLNEDPETLVEKWIKKLEGRIREAAQKARDHYVEHGPEPRPAKQIEATLDESPAPEERSRKAQAKAAKKKPPVFNKENLINRAREDRYATYGTGEAAFLLDYERHKIGRLVKAGKLRKSGRSRVHAKEVLELMEPGLYDRCCREGRTAHVEKRAPRPS